MRTLISACALLCGLGAYDLAAQAPGRTFSFMVTHSVGAGTSAHPPPCGSLCSPRDILAPLSLSTLEVELAVPLLTRARWGVAYHVRAVPLAMMRDNPTQLATKNGLGWSLPTTTARASTFGFGLKPAGLRGWVGGDDLRLEADASAGVLRFGTPLFAANGAQLNFVYEMGVGLRMSWLAPRGMVIGYRRHHVSNAGFADINPGLNSHVLFLGLPVF
jgi:hypothetical protein